MEYRITSFVIYFVVLGICCSSSAADLELNKETLKDLEAALKTIDNKTDEAKVLLLEPLVQVGLETFVRNKRDTSLSKRRERRPLDSKILSLLRKKRTTSLNAKMIQDVVDTHNFARSTVDPPASNMLEMKWDRELAANAQKHAETCIWGHSSSKSRETSKFPVVGENLFLTSSATLDATYGVRAWDKERNYYSYDFRTCETNKMCGHYTQIVWAKSEYVGCGIFTCPNGFMVGDKISYKNGTILVCQYGPAGNYVGQWPYETGQPCSKCPGGYNNCIEKLCSSAPACEPNPCKNGGTCDITGSSYECSCPAGFTGNNCETQVSPCESSPCRNGGTCKNDGLTFKCICPAGFTGRRCGTIVLPCSSAPCLNGGTCKENGTSYICSCPSGYTGNDCQYLATSPCGSNPCENGGTCEVDGSSFSCTCTSSFTGSRCLTKISACDSKPCQNGGSCTPTSTSFTCSCKPEYTGIMCESQVFPCIPNPCLNGGTCGVDGSCTCPPGMTGNRCENRASCPSDATFYITANQTQCFWPLHTKSTFEDANINCQVYGGTLAIVPDEATNDFIKITFPFNVFAGSWIGVDDKSEEGIYRDSNGKRQTYFDWALGSFDKEPTGTKSENCVVFRYNHWFDEACQTPYDVICSRSVSTCESNPCKNGGTCSDRGTSYQCQCTDNYTGDNCETKVQLEFTCTFEPGEFCVLMDCVGDTFNWTTGTGPTPTNNTGPDEAYEGNYYKYIDTRGKNFGDVAWLKSFPLPDTDLCLSFAYHMYGKSVGFLNVFHYTDNGFREIFTAAGNKGNQWNTALVDIPAATVSLIYFEGITGTSNLGNIAIDDVKITRGECDATCTFEDNNCILVQDKTDACDWTRHKGPTASSSTGPVKAYEGDYYMYLEASGKQQGDRARLYPNIAFSDKLRCLSFDYHMYGKDIGKLLVTLSSETDPRVKIFSRIGDQGDLWRKAVIDIPSLYKTKLQIEAVRGGGYAGDIAIDNIQISAGSCGCIYKPCDNGGTCFVEGAGFKCICQPGFSGETCTDVDAGVLRCLFDENCFLSNANSNPESLRWKISNDKGVIQASEPMQLLNGDFVYLHSTNTNSVLNEGSKAVLTSVGIVFDKRIRCLTFFYHLYGDAECQLRVYSKHTDWNVFHWIKPGALGSKWIPATIEIPEVDDLELQIEGEASFNSVCFIALDEIKLTPGSC